MFIPGVSSMEIEMGFSGSGEGKGGDSVRSGTGEASLEVPLVDMKRTRGDEEGGGGAGVDLTYFLRGGVGVAGWGWSQIQGRYSVRLGFKSSPHPYPALGGTRNNFVLLHKLPIADKQLRVNVHAHLPRYHIRPYHRPCRRSVD